MRSTITSSGATFLGRVLSGLLSVCLAMSMAGCANRATAQLVKNVDLRTYKSLYLIPGQEDKDNYSIIKSNLEKRGFNVTTGPEMQVPYKSDAVVTYLDKWMWDITMYMLELTVTFRDPSDYSPIAIGNSMHTSLTRKSPAEMVDEVLTNIFAAKFEPTAGASGVKTPVGTCSMPVPWKMKPAPVTGAIVRILALTATVVCSACMTIPLKSDTLLAPYTKLIVRDINWKETATSELAGAQLSEFVALQPELNRLFQSEFDKYVRELRYFDVIDYGGAPAEAGDLILIPRIDMLRPSGFRPGASYAGLLVTPDGRPVGRYAEDRTIDKARSSPEEAMDNIRRLIRALGEDAASLLPSAR